MEWRISLSTTTDKPSERPHISRKRWKYISPHNGIPAFDRRRKSQYVSKNASTFSKDFSWCGESTRAKRQETKQNVGSRRFSERSQTFRRNNHSLTRWTTRADKRPVTGSAMQSPFAKTHTNSLCNRYLTQRHFLNEEKTQGQRQESVRLQEITIPRELLGFSASTSTSKMYLVRSEAV